MPVAAPHSRTQPALTYLLRYVKSGARLVRTGRAVNDNYEKNGVHRNKTKRQHKMARDCVAGGGCGLGFIGENVV